ncbi:MAG: UbiA family prenyltransferase [Ignavibacteria bacterium]|nr:UbiA family prenyltransferase [Ignavibacteria bacterium]
MHNFEPKTIQFFNYLIFGNIFIAVCAVLMSYYTFAVFDAPVNCTLLGFIFFASISSYSFHSFLPTTEKEYSEKVKWGLQRRNYFLVLLIIGACGASVFLFFLEQDLKLILTLILFTVLYSSPKIKFDKFTFFKRFGTAKTIYLAAIWTLVTVSLPLSAMDINTGNAGILFFANRFFLIYAICILFDLKDKEYDIRRGIKSIITILDDKKIELLFFICIILFFISSLVFYIFRNSGSVVLTLIAPGTLLLFLFQRSKETKSDYWFSFILDGLMMLSAVLYLLVIIVKKIFV